MENGRLNIYGATTDTAPTIILNKYTGRILFHAIFRAGKEIWLQETADEPDGMFIFPGEEVNGTTLLPGIETRIEPVNPLAYRGTSTVAKLSFAANNNPPNGSDINVDCRTEVLHADGSPQPENDGFYIIPEKKKLIFLGREGQQIVYSNLTIKTSPKAAEGDYLITITSRYRGLAAGKIVLSFKIGKGRKKTGGKSLTEGLQNIGYSAANPLPINVTEKTEMTGIVLRDQYLKSRMLKVVGVTSEYLDLENYSGFFAVVTVDVGDPDHPGEIIRYIVDREEKKIIGSSSTPRMALEYFRGEAFDESKGNLTKKWDAWNFRGLWLDNGTNASTETLLIEKNMLDSSHRTIEKHNLIYATYSVPYKYKVFANVNVKDVAISNLPFGGRYTDYASIPPEENIETYQSMGWQGEKHAFMDGRRIAKVLLEQNASEVRTLTVSESWNMGEGYILTANSIDAKATTRQAWFTLSKNGTKLYDIVLAPRYLWMYAPENDTLPLFITYFHQIYPTLTMDAADLKYTWFRSPHTIEIKPDDIFGIMEVTSIENGRIELRNRVPIELAPDSTTNLMGNLNIKVGSSNTSLSFHPYRVKDPNNN